MSKRRFRARSLFGVHYTGCNPRHSQVGEWFPVWDGSARCPVLPQDEWKTQFSKRHLEAIDVDQNGYPACCLAATANAIQFSLAEKGRAVLKCDWYKAWHTLSGGRGGVAIDAALRYIMNTGMPIVGGGVVKIVEAWDTKSADAFLSGLQLGCMGIFGAQGHAECCTTVQIGVSEKPVAWEEIDNENTDVSLPLLDRWPVEAADVWADTRNTWGKSFGEQGWHWTSRKKLAGGLPSYGAYLIRGIEIRDVDGAEFPDALG